MAPSPKRHGPHPLDQLEPLAPGRPASAAGARSRRTACVAPPRAPAAGGVHAAARGPSAAAGARAMSCAILRREHGIGVRELEHHERRGLAGRPFGDVGAGRETRARPDPARPWWRASTRSRRRWRTAHQIPDGRRRGQRPARRSPSVRFTLGEKLADPVPLARRCTAPTQVMPPYQMAEASAIGDEGPDGAEIRPGRRTAAPRRGCRGGTG